MLKSQDRREENLVAAKLVLVPVFAQVETDKDQRWHKVEALSRRPQHSFHIVVPSRLSSC